VADRFSVGLTPEAEADVNLMLCQYDVRNPRAGKRFSLRLTRAIDQIANYPESAPIQEGNVRKLVLNPLPYAVYYAVLQNNRQVLIGAILHVHQHPEKRKERF